MNKKLIVLLLAFCPTPAFCMGRLVDFSKINLDDAASFPVTLPRDAWPKVISMEFKSSCEARNPQEAKPSVIQEVSGSFITPREKEVAYLIDCDDQMAKGRHSHMQDLVIVSSGEVRKSFRLDGNNWIVSKVNFNDQMVDELLVANQDGFSGVGFVWAKLIRFDNYEVVNDFGAVRVDACLAPKGVETWKEIRFLPGEKEEWPQIQIRERSRSCK